MNRKTSYVLRITFALASLAALALLLPVLGMILLGLLTLVAPMLLVLTPVLGVLMVGFLVDRARGKHEPAGVPGTEPMPIGAPALPAPTP